MTKKNLSFSEVNFARLVFGERDKNLAEIEKFFGVEIFPQGTDLQIQGKAENCQLAFRLLQELYSLAKKGISLSSNEVAHAARAVEKDPGQALDHIFSDQVVTTTHNKGVTPKTTTQKLYVDLIRELDIVFGWGPAGTGKTYLAMAMAVSALTRKEVDRIILTRPAVEAGEKLGFLPGDMAEKVNPYLRPLYDALHDMMNFERVEQLITTGIIEVAPLAFMRGRTLKRSFVILDEAQNTTPEQMKMFLTRLGFQSKALITGDITQVDLPFGKKSGLNHALEVLEDVSEIGIVEFTDKDVVRHPLVQKIILAYEKAEQKNQDRQ